MAITQYSLTASAFTAISAAGESGTCWLDEDNDGAGGSVDVRIFHAASLPIPAKATEGKRVYKPRGNLDVVSITADDVSDIYYAICKDSGSTAVISVDVI